MTGDSLRAFRYGLQTNRSILPASFKAVPLSDYDHDTSKRGRETQMLLRDVVNRAAATLRKGEYDSIKISTDLKYDWQEDFHAALWGAPTTSAHSGASGAYDSVFLDNDADILMAVRFEDSEGWWEMIDCCVNKVDYKQDNGGILKEDWELVGPKAYPLGVQTFTIAGTPTGGTYTVTVPASANADYPAQTTAAIVYNATAAQLQSALQALTRIGPGGATVVRTGSSPNYSYQILLQQKASPIGTMTITSSITGGTSPTITNVVSSFGTAFPLAESNADYAATDWSHFLGRINGVDAEIRSWSLSVDRKRTPEYTGRRTTNPSYFAKPAVEIKGSILPDYHLTGDAGSLFEQFRNGVVKPALEFDYISIADAIGSGTPTIPNFNLKVLAAGLNSGKHSIKDVPSTTPIDFTALQSLSNGGASIRTSFTNEQNGVTLS